MKVLVVGSGGREHALAWALNRDPEVRELYAAPGNPGIAEVATCVPINPTDIEQLASFATTRSIDMTVVGPEAPLALGIVDSFQKKGLRIFGPDRKAAQIETSKSFAKNLCSRFGIPTPHWETFTSAANATKALDHLVPPWVIKADGLASGKGTTVTSDREEAKAAIHRELEREPGRIVIEQFIDGWEASFMVTVSAGRTQWLAPILQDYKPAFDGDIGPNTGGMGVYTPVQRVTPSLVERVEKTILTPAVRGMEETMIPFHGLLYLNAIIPHGTEDPYVLEFNARFGDPETQGVAPLVKKGLSAHLRGIAENSSTPPVPECLDSACVVVVLASKGYPTNPSIGDGITIRPFSNPNVVVFYAGTARNPAGELVTAGGRVLNVVATGANVDSARKEAYSLIGSAVHFSGMHYRSDIGSPHPRRRRETLNQSPSFQSGG